MKRVRQPKLGEWISNHRISYRRGRVPLEVETDRNIGLTFKTEAARDNFDGFYGAVLRWRRIKLVLPGA